MSEIAEAEHKTQMDAMFRSHVERCLQDAWDQPDLVADDDGDYAYRSGTSLCWVSVDTGPMPGVRVFAQAAAGLRRTARLLTEVNEINAGSRWARVFWDGRAVMVAAEIPWMSTDRSTLAHYTQVVGSVADDIGGLLAAVYGGSTPFPADDESEVQDAGHGEDAA